MINNWAEDGEPRQDLPEDAVEEFRVTNSSYKAEFGLATGGVVQVVTKSGHQPVSRHRCSSTGGTRASIRTACSRPRSRSTQRHQFGGSAGGPIVPEQAALLRLVRADGPGGVLHGQHRPAAVLRLARGHVPRVPRGATCIRCAAIGRSATHRTRSAATSDENEEKACQGCGGTSASGRDEGIPRRSIVVGHTWIRGARALNDFRFQYAYAAFYGYPGRDASPGRRPDSFHRNGWTDRRGSTRSRRSPTATTTTTSAPRAAGDSRTPTR